MYIDHLISFALASTVILIIPGPTIILVVSQTVTHGRKSVLPLVIGVLCGDLTAMTASLLGLGALMSASATLFAICKWVGALYLCYLGIKLWVAKPEQTLNETSGIERTNRTSLFRSSYIVTALNPKSIAFFIAFLPQFIHPSGPVLQQLILLGGIFLLLATINAALYAICAEQLRHHLRKQGVRKCFNRFGGSALIGAGLLAATVHQSS